MSVHEKIAVQFYDYLQGDLPAEARRSVDDHLATCGDCSRELESVREFAGLLRPERTPAEERGGDFWLNFPAGVERRISGGEKKRSVGIVESLYSLFALNKKVTVSFSVAMVALFLLGLWMVNFEKPAEKAAGPASVAAADSIPVDARIGNYFRKSKTLLVGLSNIETPPAGDVSPNLDLEQGISRELMAESRKIRREPVDIRSAELIKEMDKLLAEFSGIPSRPSGQEMENIRRQIYSQNLLFKVRMAETSFRTVSRQESARVGGRTP